MVDKWIGKVAVVTGASSGNGAAIFKEFARNGINVVDLARRQERFRSTVGEASVRLDRKQVWCRKYFGQQRRRLQESKHFGRWWRSFSENEQSHRHELPRSDAMYARSFSFDEKIRRLRPDHQHQLDRGTQHSLDGFSHEFICTNEVCCHRNHRSCSSRTYRSWKQKSSRRCK